MEPHGGDVRLARGDLCQPVCGEPLPALLLANASNITPDNLPKALIEPVLEACDDHLREVVDIMGITRIVGVGKYAEKRARLAFNAEKKGPGRTSTARH